MEGLLWREVGDLACVEVIDYNKKNEERERSNDVPAANAVHIEWACTAPENNVYEYGTQKFKGVGGHLLAYAGNKSVELGHGGFIFAEAMDSELFNYFINEFGAEPFPFGTPPHPYRFVIDEDTMVPIMEVYNYDDNGEEY